MSKLRAKIDFTQFTDAAFDETCGTIKNQLTDNGADFPGLPITMVIFGGHLVNYRTIADLPIYPEKTADLNAARTILEEDLRQHGNHINTIANGNAVLLAKSGYPVSKEPTPIGPLAKAGFKNVKSIPNGFEIELDKVPHALVYIVCLKPTVQATTNDYKKWPWYTTTTTKLRIDDLDSAVKYTLVAVAIGSDPTLTFSDEVKGVTQ
jgi:hypothetical protein